METKLEITKEELRAISSKYWEKYWYKKRVLEGRKGGIPYPSVDLMYSIYPYEEILRVPIGYGSSAYRDLEKLRLHKAELQRSIEFGRIYKDFVESSKGYKRLDYEMSLKQGGM